MSDVIGAVARYNSVSRLLHWAIAILILANLPLGLFSDAIETATGASPMWIHKSIGLTVLVLSLARLAWRLTNPPPPYPGGTSRGELKLAWAVHGILYALMILVPLTGYMMSSAGKYPLTWFALFPIPKLPVAKGSPAAEIAGEGHELLGLLLGLLAIGHIVAALRHGFVLRDGIFQRMAGGRR